MIWAIAAVVVVALVCVTAWDMHRRHVTTRTLWNEARVAALEEKAEALKDTGLVLKSLATKLSALEAYAKRELGG